MTEIQKPSFILLLHREKCTWVQSCTSWSHNEKWSKNVHFIIFGLMSILKIHFCGKRDTCFVYWSLSQKVYCEGISIIVAIWEAVLMKVEKLAVCPCSLHNECAKKGQFVYIRKIGVLYAASGWIFCWRTIRNSSPKSWKKFKCEHRGRAMFTFHI